MVNYNNLDSKGKHDLKSQITSHAALLGGKNHFLSLIEDLRNTHPNPLMAKEKTFRFRKGTIKWEKSIFKDKVQLLDKIIKSSVGDNNVMPNKSNHNYKNTLNLLRTISPITFSVKPKNRKDGEGFSFKPIEVIDENTCHINFIFEVLFFLPIHLIKKIYNDPLKKE